MKYLFLLAASAALVGCGKVALNGSRIGESKKYDPISVSPTNNLRNICSAIDDKTNKLMGDNGKYQFSFAQKSCYDPDEPVSKQPSFVSEPPFSTTIAISDIYYFRREIGGGKFYDVETSSTGVISHICNSLSSLKDQIKISNTQFITFSTNTLTTDCSANSGQQCFQVSYWSLEPGSVDTYKHHTTEFLKFNISDQAPKRGFWAERKKISSGSCGGRLQTDQIATLVN